MTLYTWHCPNCRRKGNVAKANRTWAARAARRHHCAPRGALVLPIEVPA